nr:retrovirus-related Pol polyprotein from transposon TNT 1-94 [Tanacetum cinerariifolium]
GHSHKRLKDQGYFDSGCSRHMIGNLSYLTNFKEFDRGYVAFGEGAKGGKITGKGIIRIATKVETSRILKSFIVEIENLVDKKVKIIRCDNETEYKNSIMNKFCKEKCIKKEHSVARTPLQNRVAKRRNKTLIKAARTILADSKLPFTFWAKAVNTTCYVQNRVLVVKPHFKTLYELFRGRTPVLSFMRPFGCHVIILNTLDHLGKFDGKLDEGFFVGYSTNSKAFRVYNTRTRKVEENLHINFLENKPIIADGDNKDNDGPCNESKIDNQECPNAENSTKDVNTAGPSINTASSNINTASPTVNTASQTDDFFGANNDMRSLDGVEVDISNISTTYHVPTTLDTRIHKDHSLDNVISDMQSGGFTQEEGIDYDEVFARVARIEAIRIFLAYASFMGFLVYQMDVKSAFLYGRIKEEVYVCQPPRFEDPDYPDKVYKELCTEFEELIHDKFQISLTGEITFFVGLQVKQKSDRIFNSQELDEILRKFKYADVKPANTPMDKEKALLKDSDGDDVDVHLYRSMIGSLMYLTSSKPNIMFVVYTCAKFQCKKQTVVAISTTKAEYVVAASCCGQIQKKNYVKARSMLLMPLLNEHLMTFNQYKDAKSLLDAITTRFGGNDATRKTQKTLLKQMYENFSA